MFELVLNSGPADSYFECLQGDSTKLCASILVQSAASDVVIARYEEWLRRTGQTEPDTWLDRIDNAISLASTSTDALFAIGRGHTTDNNDIVDGITAYWAQTMRCEVGWVPKPRGRGASAGRGRVVKVVTVSVFVETEEEVVEEMTGAQESDPGGKPKRSGRGRKIAMCVAVCVVAVAVPVALSWCLGTITWQKDQEINVSA